MGDKNLLFEKPVGILARAMDTEHFGPDAVIVIKVVQNGFKIRVMGETFVEKEIEAASNLIKEKLDSLVKNLKKNDK